MGALGSRVALSPITERDHVPRQLTGIRHPAVPDLPAARDGESAAAGDCGFAALWWKTTPHTPQCTHDTEHTQGVCACVWVVCGVGVRCAHADPQISEGGCALRHSELDRAFASGHPLSQQAGITLLRYSARLIQRGRSGSTSSNTPQIIISIANGLSISYALALRAPVGSSS